ncbi:MAG: metallophosphoesterase [Bacteroidales bacterium]|nr:metallophosphoesterase [Bacteroidales bacterium]
MFKILFAILPVIYLAGNGYLYWRTLQLISTLPLWSKVVVSVLFWTAAFSMFISLALRDAGLSDLLLRLLYMTGSIWMVFLLYCVILLAAFDVARIVWPALGPGLKYAAPLAVCMLAAGYVIYLHPKVERLEIVLDKPMEDLTVVAVSDVHLGHGTGVKALKKYVGMINSQNPDVVVVAGDLIDNSVQPLLNAPFAEILDSIDAPDGIYMVPGNHEYISGIDACEAFVSGTRITMLRDSIAALPGGLQLVGRDDRSNGNRLSLDMLLAGADMSKPVFVLDHQPYCLAQSDSLGVDIQFSGHTHRGQIWPLNWLTDALYEQSHGYRKWSHAHIFVSSGLSLWGPPFRIGTRSDMAVLHISGTGC